MKYFSAQVLFVLLGMAPASFGSPVDYSRLLDAIGPNGAKLGACEVKFGSNPYSLTHTFIEDGKRVVKPVVGFLSVLSTSNLLPPHSAKGLNFDLPVSHDLTLFYYGHHYKDDMTVESTESGGLRFTLTTYSGGQDEFTYYYKERVLLEFAKTGELVRLVPESYQQTDVLAGLIKQKLYESGLGVPGIRWGKNNLAGFTCQDAPK